MSYILDALKRADAERERGRVPGLHAQPMSLSTSEEEARSGPSRWAVITGVAVAGVVVAALAWRMGADANAPLPAAAVPAPSPAVADASAPPPASTSVAATEPAPAPVVTPPPQAPPAPPLPAQAATKPAARPAAPPTPPPRSTAEPAQPPVAKAPAAPARAPIVALADLPASVRKQLPPLVVGGSIYSDEVASRFLILNGEVFHEGGKPGPDLLLERIEPKGAVFRFKDQRFRIAY